LREAPNDKGLHHKLGDLYLKNGEKEKAVNEYLKAGDLHVEEDLNARAIAIYKKVFRLTPSILKHSVEWETIFQRRFARKCKELL
jgi:hypothetical protein